MDKIISTALLTVVSMILVVVMFNSAYPAVQEGSQSITSISQRAETEMRSDITLIHSAAELDQSGWWQDTNSNGRFDVFTWVKNTGVTRFNNIEGMDIFFGPESNFTRIPHESNAGGSLPYWTYSVEDGGEWVPSATLRINVQYGAPLASGRYFIRVVIPTGEYVDEVISF